MQDAIYNAVRAKMLEWYPEHIDRPGVCFYWMHCGLVTLYRYGIVAIPQAGDLHWPIPEQQCPLTGDIVNRFSYEWSPERPESQFAVSQGMLPEIHIWLAIPERNELVDFSTCGFREAAKQVGLTWGAEDPPPYLWVREGDPMPATYQPRREAIGYVLRKFFSEERAA